LNYHCESANASSITTRVVLARPTTYAIYGSDGLRNYKLRCPSLMSRTNYQSLLVVVTRLLQHGI